ncbi:MAG: C40 family peptidase, partial [Actinobacteria bacterium]|nr:C40 family peptidase [Actinomycetota bacterium]
FIRLRDLVAADAATRLGIDPLRMQAAWAGADQPHQLAVLAGLTQLGVPYRYLARKPGVGFDCSGLTSWAWEQAGLAIPRSSRYQINDLPEITMATAQAGDLVYYPGHVMLYLGVDYAILQSPRTGRVVTVASVWNRKLEKLRWVNPLG